MSDKNCQPPKSLGQLTYEKYNEAKGGLTWDGKPIPTWDENKDESVKSAWEAAAQYASELGARKAWEWKEERKPFLVDAYHPEPNIASTEMIWEDTTESQIKLKSVLGIKAGIAERTLALRHLEDAENRLARALREMVNEYNQQPADLSSPE